MNLLDTAATELGELVLPLRRVLEDDAPPRALADLLARAGWSIPLGADVAAPVAALGDVIEALDGLPGSVGTDGLLEVVQSLTALAAAVQEIEQLAPALAGLFSEVADNPGAVAGALAEDLAHSLTLRWLARRAPKTLQVFKALRLVRPVPVTAIGGGGIDLRRAGKLNRLQPAALLALLRDPVGALSAAYTTGAFASTHDAQVLNLALASRLGTLAALAGGDLSTRWPWQGPELIEPADPAGERTLMLSLPLPGAEATPFAVAAQLLSARDRGVLGRTGPGVELELSGLAALSTTLETWSFELAVAAGAPRIMVTPSSVFAEDGGSVVADLEIRGGGEPLVLGADHGTRLELGTPVLRAGLELAGTPDVSVEVTLEDCALVVTAGDGDSFVAHVLPKTELRAEFDLGLEWSRSGGIRLAAGGLGLALHLPIDEELGPLTIESVDLALALGDADLALDLGVTASLAIGPFAARIERVGLRTLLDFPAERDGNLGFADLALEFLPPQGFGLSLDLEAASGGGYVWIDPENGRYVGALELEFLAVGLQAIVVVDTRIPGDPNAWALFASLSLTFPSVPLGFGFFLSGVGGIVCLNRTLDVQALAAGLDSGAVNTILFPEDALAAAPQIVSQLDEWFPLADGSMVFGVACRITWGAPRPLVTADLGIALSLPDLDLVVLGSVAIALPDEDTALLELHMDALGAIEFSERTVTIAAALYDSSLLHIFQLSGEMAMYGRFGADPYFLLSVGGYHPDFQPPSELPASVTDLDRMRVEVKLSEDVWYALEAYVAITSNTLQFGSEATLEASAKFLLTTYTARGNAGFDVLLVLDPFAFSAGFHASVSITAGNKELFNVSLSAHLEGPKPWYAVGQASFDFFGIEVPFQIEVGGSGAAEAPPRKNVLEDVVAGFVWRGVRPAGSAVTLAEAEPPEGEAWAHPDAELEAVQTVAPLARTLERYGAYEITGPARLDVTSVALGGEALDAWDSVEDWFAPAQFEDMTRNEQIGAPSYERMAAGVRFASEGATFGAQTRTVTPSYEEKVIEEETTRPLSGTGTVRDMTAATAALMLDATRRPSSRSVTSTRYELAR